MTMNITIHLNEDAPLSSLRALLDYLDGQDVVEMYDIDLTAPESLDDIATRVMPFEGLDVKAATEMIKGVTAAVASRPLDNRPLDHQDPFDHFECTKVPCPTCKAERFNDCRTAGGRLYSTYVHKARAMRAMGVYPGDK